jgi:hypothetical protein
MFRVWWTNRVFASRVRRAVRRFNRMLPQQRVAVMIQLLRDNPELAIQFRRALKIEDAPQDRRIELATAVPRRTRPRS